MHDSTQLEPAAQIKEKRKLEWRKRFWSWLWPMVEHRGARQQPCWFASRFCSFYPPLRSATIMFIITGPLDWARKTSRWVKTTAETWTLSHRRCGPQQQQPRGDFRLPVNWNFTKRETEIFSKLSFEPRACLLPSNQSAVSHMSPGSIGLSLPENKNGDVGVPCGDWAMLLDEVRNQVWGL